MAPDVGIEPTSSLLESEALPLDQSDMVYRPGYAPGPAPSQGGVQLLHQRQGGWRGSRTPKAKAGGLQPLDLANGHAHPWSI
jgi:hypothetical protein